MIRLAVTLAADTANPLGIPDMWPIAVEEVSDDAVLIQYPTLEMSPLQYEQYRASYQDAYDAWETGRDLQIAKYGDDGKGGKSNELWQACYDFNFQFFSGGAYAQILELKLAGVSRAVATQGWIIRLWTEYYTRKYILSLATTLPQVAATNLDFSSVGPPPYDVPAMMAEAVEMGLVD